MPADLAIADAVIAAVVLLSGLFGLLRGLVKEIVALMVWLGAAFLGMNFGPPLAAGMGLELGERLRNAIGFGTVFVAVLVAGALLQRMLRGLIQSTGLTGTDRTLGLVFGALRGVTVVVVALLMLRPVAAERVWWDESVLAPPLLALEGDLLEVVNVVRDAFGVAPVRSLDDAARAITFEARR